MALPDFRSGAISAAATLAGLPWRLKPGHGKPLLPSDPRLKRVVVLKPCCMGDVLMSTPAIAALRKAVPGSYISMAVGAYSRQAIANNPRLSSTLEIPAFDQDPAPTAYLRLANRIRKGHFGAAVVLDRSPLLNMVPYLAGVPLRAGLDSGGRGLALSHPVPCPESKVRHEVEWYLDMVRALGLPALSGDAYLEFYPVEADRIEARRVLSEAVGEDESEAGYIAIHLGGGVNPGMRLLSKRWRPESWARIADWLAETYEPNILLLGGPGIEDRAAAQIFKAALFPATRPFVVDLVGRLSWGATAALLERCKLFLGHDTGAMHLATAVRTPVVAVFGPSDPARFGPWDPSGRSVVVSHTEARSTASSLREASQSEELYHNLVSVEEVWAAVEQAYSRSLGKEVARR